LACKGGEKTLRRIEIGSSELEDRRINIVLVADEIDWQSPENTLYGFGGCIAPEKFAHLESLLKKNCYLRTWDNYGCSMDYGPYPCHARVVVDEEIAHEAVRLARSTPVRCCTAPRTLEMLVDRRFRPVESSGSPAISRRYLFLVVCPSRGKVLEVVLEGIYS